LANYPIPWGEDEELKKNWKFMMSKKLRRLDSGLCPPAARSGSKIQGRVEDKKLSREALIG
jgi:hypothetical protein